MRAGTKVAIGVGAAAVTSGIVALVLSRGEDSDTAGNLDDLSGRWEFSGTVTTEGCPAEQNGICPLGDILPVCDPYIVRNGTSNFSGAWIDVNQAGTTLSGSAYYNTLNGVVDGNVVSFTIESVDEGGTGQGEVTTAFWGTLTGNTIQGDFSGSGSWQDDEIGQTGTFTWTGTFTVFIS
jgi:hypothetical protein